MVEEIIRIKPDIYLDSKMKLDSWFLFDQFFIVCFAIQYRFGRNQNGEGLISYIREAITS